MITITIIAVLIVVAVVLIKMNHFRHKMTIIAVLVFALFLYSTVTIVHKANEFDLTTTEGVFDALKVYLGWLGNGFGNLKTLTGNAIKMDWSSTNGTFLSEEIDALKK
jgi:hypothetical protein